MQIGGPALTTNNDLTGYRESLLGYIRANRLPLDFYSIHHYTDFTNYEIPAADQGPFPNPPIVNDTFAIPGIGTFTLLPRRSVSYLDNGGHDLTVNHIRHGRSRVIVSRYRVDGSHNLTLIDRRLERGDTVHVSAALPAPAVELVTITPLRAW